MYFVSYSLSLLYFILFHKIFEQLFGWVGVDESDKGAVGVVRCSLHGQARLGRETKTAGLCSDPVPVAAEVP